MTALEPEIVISCLRGEDLLEATAVMEDVLSIAQQRLRTGWAGDPTTIVIVPSSEVLRRGIVDIVQVLARIGRAAGIQLRLLDGTPPLPRPPDQAEGTDPYPSLATCGDTVLREFVVSPDMPHITWHHLSPVELANMAEQEL